MIVASAYAREWPTKPTLSGADSIGHGGTCPPPPLLQMAGHGSRRTANKKLTKLY